MQFLIKNIKLHIVTDTKAEVTHTVVPSDKRYQTSILASTDYNIKILSFFFHCLALQWLPCNTPQGKQITETFILCVFDVPDNFVSPGKRWFPESVRGTGRGC